ncbi:hypothetical protein P43SY_004150 [Pythium insidiosum]|uniref:alpha-1,2-Mannosidase n=1 Tax=Pythium insidiosum TaxID=114742 RepID=A0AAD5LCP5_PYTIN|nr:hypothetical protein P43SY_004150 [Pythium insidiosum]
MLPTTSKTPASPRAPPRPRLLRRRMWLLLLLTTGVGVFLWLQFTMLRANVLALPDRFSGLRRAPQGVITSTSESHRLRAATTAKTAAQGGQAEPIDSPPNAAALRGETAAPPPAVAKPTANANAAADTSSRMAVWLARHAASAGAVSPVSAAEQERRRAGVKSAMQFVWRNYEEHAFGGDEIDPISGNMVADAWGGIACTMVDALDTLWIMGMKDEFARARDYVASKLRFDHLGANPSSHISVFETIIREVGGLLSAFELSKDAIFKAKAQELMDLLAPAFDASEGVYYTYFNPKTKHKHFPPWSGHMAHVADIGSLQLESRYLSDITQDPSYAKRGDAFYDILRKQPSFQDSGLFPVRFDSKRGKFNSDGGVITIGALGDSFYEYLLKVYIYSGRRKADSFLRDLYDNAVRGMEEKLLEYSKEDDLFYLKEIALPFESSVNRMDHLLCFVPGLLALGVMGEQPDSARAARQLNLSKVLMETCYQMYHRQPTGLSPDIVEFPGMSSRDPKYRLRPETVESLFYLYRVTKDDKYREYGWEIFQSLEKHARAEYGFAAVLDVDVLPAKLENKQESFFLAETLKYHYLLQSPDDVIPLDEFVFNTEAHPVRIRQ